MERGGLRKMTVTDESERETERDNERCMLDQARQTRQTGPDRASSRPCTYRIDASCTVVWDRLAAREEQNFELFDPLSGRLV